MLLVSRWTIRRRVVEYGLEETTGFFALSDEQIDFYVKQFSDKHENLLGFLRHLASDWYLKSKYFSNRSA